MPSGSRASVSVRVLAVPDRDREHAFQPAPGVVAPIREGGEDRLGVAVACGMDNRRKLAPDVEVVVDFAVEHDRKAAVGGVHRLMAAGDVDDAEPPHAEAEVAIDEDAAIVGSAMADDVALRLNDRFGHGTTLPPLRYQPAIPHM